MASQIDRVVTELRRRILAGVLAPGERILEVACSKALGVSRTPLRLALGELEKEGLLERLKSRGFRVRRVTLDEVAMAIDVRGTLEGMAVRLLAESGPTSRQLTPMRACLAEGRAIVDRARDAGEPIDMPAWAAMNARFHRTLVQECGNAALASALDHVAKTPLAGPGVLGVGIEVSIEASFVQRAQLDHEDIVRALEAREGARAEALMREHARRSRDNKRVLIAALNRDPWPGHVHQIDEPTDASRTPLVDTAAQPDPSRRERGG